MSTGIHHATNQSIKPFKSSEEYLYAMKEDLAEWLRDLYEIDIDVNNILEALETGAVLCSHANNVTRVAGEFIQKYGMVRHVQLPTNGVTFVNSAQPATFLARDNISNFISWCRKHMDIKDVLMFETDDLVLRKNEKNFVLCLLEVARRASRFGMAAPVLIQLEQEIEEEIREELELPLEETPPLAKSQRRTSNTQNLDEMVQCLISRCTCPTQFPMFKVSEGKYRVGDSSTLIFVRVWFVCVRPHACPCFQILRNHVMVRVGGGWDTLEHYLDKHDPCRCTSITHKLAQRPGTPVHEIKGRLPGRPDGQGPTMPTMLIMSRHAQTPFQPVLWAPTEAPSTYSPRGLRPARTRGSLSPDTGLRASCSPNRSSLSPDPGPRFSREMKTTFCNRLRQSASTPTLQHHQSGRNDDSALNSSMRTGREATRSSHAPRFTSSLPRYIQHSSTPQPKTKPQAQRPRTPLVFHRSPGQQSSQPSPENGLTQTWTKSQFASKLRQSSMLGGNSTEPSTSTAPQRNGGPNAVRAATPARYTPVCPRQPTITIQQPENIDTLQKSPDLIRSFCPAKTFCEESSGECQVRPFTPIGGNLRDPNKTPTHYDITTNPSHSDSNHERMQGLTRQTAFGFPVNDKASHKSTVVSLEEPEHPELCGKVFVAGDRAIDNACLFTPPPISPAQEASLYQSLEHEILSNLQQLSIDSDDRKCKQNGQYQPSQNIAENDYGGFSTVLAGFEPSPHTSASYATHPVEASFDAVITELSKGNRLLEKVCVESWVKTLSGSPRARETCSNTEVVNSSLNLKVAKACVTSSWSSMGSGVESKELPANSTFSPDSGNGVSISIRRRVTDANSLVVNPRATTITGPDSLLKPRYGSFRQKRTLKKPESVPSIYKLKLRPRHDYRPGKKPSRIPTPIPYKGGQPAGDPGGSRRGTHT
ncbi:GAS2-like protein 2A isoform X1 [Oncorhynchus tshawytscha]|uniref:GAS2-like protein 2 n=1 Tax=Oncorhynchus tshawytscha TaxID=74940 RepID=A0A8C8INS4_ONCTS|nr:GAS2-like protein 2A isoform X1 [Oncorhynchus tshawytscha]